MSQSTAPLQAYHPVAIEHNHSLLHQYRGIKYGKVPHRFADPEPVPMSPRSSAVDCTQFGPICPQVTTDFYHLLRVSESLESQDAKLMYDEFECLNLDVTLPAGPATNLPIMIWIHGGSQTMTFIPASSACADVVPFVARSAEQGRPMIVVYVNYRLNIFAFGDGKRGQNLALKDQRLAIDWVVEHIDKFGGDPTNITLAGESAGAVYVHAHVVTDAPVRRAILQSGSLHLSPPRGLVDGQNMVTKVAANLEKQGFTLMDAPIAALLKTLDEENLVSMWLQLTEDLKGWQSRVGHIEELIVGDVEFESAIWRNGIENFTAGEVMACFDTAGPYAARLKELYNVVDTRPTSCKHAALDFINDTRFALPVLYLRDLFRKAGRDVYTYVFDQTNPWQSSSRAHHAVDLIMLFGSLDFAHNPGASSVRDSIRNKWIEFCNGEAPWLVEKRYAFGPHGRCGNIENEEYVGRRRLRACALLREMGPGLYNPLFAQLAAGRISLLN